MSHTNRGDFPLPRLVDECPATYRDRHGEEQTTLHNDGLTLRLTLRGVEFVSWFDDFEPSPNTPIQNLQTFTLYDGDLCDYSLTFSLPITVANYDSCWSLATRLTVAIEVGKPASNHQVDREKLTLSLVLENGHYASELSNVSFENAMIGLQAKLPPGVFVKSCFSCAFSDYSPYEYGSFGCLLCFRHTKNEYLATRGKSDLFRLLPMAAGRVQETFLCPEYERRIPGTGYRG